MYSLTQKVLLDYTILHYLINRRKCTRLFNISLLFQNFNWRAT